MAQLASYGEAVAWREDGGVGVRWRRGAPGSAGTMGGAVPGAGPAAAASRREPCGGGGAAARSEVTEEHSEREQHGRQWQDRPHPRSGLPRQGRRHQVAVSTSTSSSPSPSILHQC